MELNALTAVSPIDGRYRGKTQDFASYFSEYALIKYRVRVEIEYFMNCRSHSWKGLTRTSSSVCVTSTAISRRQMHSV